MNPQSEVIKQVLSELNAAGLDYMIVGSHAASVHGFVRDTHDMDVVVALDPAAIHPLAETLGEAFYFDEDAAVDATTQHDMFNIIHYDSGEKVDFWILNDDDFSRTQFARRQPTAVWGVPTFIESPEDTVLSKLRWYRITPSERQLSDVKGILSIRKDTLDYGYLRHWAESLGVNDLLDSLIEKEQ